MEYSELLENIKFNDYFHVLQLRRRGKLFFFLLSFVEILTPYQKFYRE